MNLGSILFALRWLVNDTFRQSLAGYVFWILFGVSALAIVFCLGVSVEGGTVRDEGAIFDAATGKPMVGPNPNPGTLRLLFGAVSAPIPRGPAEAVRFLHVFLAVWVAGTMGLLLMLVWTANFVPDFLRPESAAVLLAKPAPRWLFLLGKYLGATLFVAAQGGVFFVGTWLALGLRTGVWNNAYLVGWPMLVVQFAIFYAVSVLLATAWRSTMACVLGVLAFWAVSFGVNYGRYAVLALPEIGGREARPLSPMATGLIEAGYWLFPKPADLAMMLEDLLHAEQDKATLSGMPEFKYGREHGHYQPFAALAASLAFGAAALALAARQLAETDY